MEHNIVLFPLLGMEFDGLSIRFLQDRGQVEALLGQPETVRGNRQYYCNGELALDFDASGWLEFIEFLGGADSALRPDLFGQDAFAVDADELLEMLKEKNGPDVDDSEAGYSYALRALSIGLYREITPEDMNAMLREMCRMDLTQMGGLDIEEEQKKARHWNTIGMGRAGYYG